MPPLRRVDPTRPPTWAARVVARLATTRPARLVSRLVGWKLDPILLRLTRGRLASTVMIPTTVIETRGARSRQLRRNAVIYFHDGDHVVVVASHAGAPTHPAWYHNLCADPDVVVGGTPMRAEVIEDEAERERLWVLADRVFPGYAVYRRDAARAGRTIPLVRLTAT